MASASTVSGTIAPSPEPRMIALSARQFRRRSIAAFAWPADFIFRQFWRVQRVRAGLAYALYQPHAAETGGAEAGLREAAMTSGRKPSSRGVGNFDSGFG